MNITTPKWQTADISGSFFVFEFFSVLKDIDPYFKKFNSPEDVIKQTPKNKKHLLKVVKFASISLELYNCSQRFFTTFPIAQETRPTDFTQLFLTFKDRKKELDHFIKDFTLEVVFTAHPTEVFPLSVTKTFNRIEVLIEKLYTSKNPERKYRLLQGLRAHFVSIWMTEELNRIKPTPEEEADRLLYIFEQSIWKMIPYFNRRYYFEYKKTFSKSPKSYPQLKFSSWIGGDRDGNPFVTADSTEKILLKSRKLGVRLVLRELVTLREETLIKTSSPELKKIFPKSSTPYSELFADLVHFLSQALRQDSLHDLTHLEKYIKERLKLAYDSLCEVGAKRVADRRLRSLIDRVNTFGLCPLNLDLRQDSEVHAQILEEVKNHKLKKITSKNIELLSDLAQDFFKTVHLVKKFSPSPFNVYIISMTRSSKDLVNLQKLFDIAGVNIPISPLFETPDDIKKAPQSLSEALSAKVNLSQIMWGYSDSTKKGGRFSSAWNLYKMQQKTLEHDLIHFHGRGGSIARGGGNIKDVFSLLPPQIIKNHFRQTFQGEVIQDEFGLPMRSLRSVEKLLKHCAYNQLIEEKPITKKLSKKLDQFAHESEALFKEKFYNDSKFTQAFDQFSPISIINQMNMGSRPAKRNSKKMGVNYRAIPWVFSWSQSRGCLPLWYGMEAFLKELREISSEHKFIKSYHNLISFGLGQAEPEIFKLYFGKSLGKIPSQLVTLKKDYQSPKQLKEKKAFAQFLHQTQLQFLKDETSEPLIEDIKRVTVQGLASYLGKSG